LLREKKIKLSENKLNIFLGIFVKYLECRKKDKDQRDEIAKVTLHQSSLSIIKTIVNVNL